MMREIEFYLVEVELRGLEPLTPCLQTTGSTSTGVHTRRSLSPERASASLQIRTCCGTSVLYAYKPQREGAGMCVRPFLVPGAAPGVGCSVRCHEYLDPT